ncbi:hypothetical protein PFISCL1PPCAC_25540, partial [Pristionchus fissidentatus]
ISSLLLPIRYPSSLVYLRIDSFFSLIFECGEILKSADEIHANNKCSKKKKLPEFFLNLTPIYSSDPIDNSLLSEIYSDHLKTDITRDACMRSGKTFENYF